MVRRRGPSSREGGLADGRVSGRGAVSTRSFGSPGGSIGRRTPIDVTTGGSRPPKPRIDAQRNLVKVLAAADFLLCEVGEGISVGRIADRAGVGIGTVYRHFSTKDALVEAVLAGQLEDLCAELELLVGFSDPERAFVGSFALIAEAVTERGSLRSALVWSTSRGRLLFALPERFVRLISEVVVSAQAAGAVRQDVEVDEVLILIGAISDAAKHSGTTTALRLTDVVIDGLSQVDRRAPFKWPT